MTSEANRAIVTSLMEALAQGDGGPFVAAMDDDFIWEIIGTTPWSGRYAGKADVRARLLTPLFGQFASQYRNRAINVFADGDVVVVECRGDVATKSGKRYDNEYCYVIRMKDGRMKALREYLDTALVEKALDPPSSSV